MDSLICPSYEVETPLLFMDDFSSEDRGNQLTFKLTFVYKQVASINDYLRMCNFAWQPQVTGSTNIISTNGRDFESHQQNHVVQSGSWCLLLAPKATPAPSTD